MDAPIHTPLLVKYPGMDTLAGFPDPPPVILIYAQPTKNSGDPGICSAICSILTRYLGTNVA